MHDETSFLKTLMVLSLAMGIIALLDFIFLTSQTIKIIGLFLFFFSIITSTLLLLILESGPLSEAAEYFFLCVLIITLVLGFVLSGLQLANLFGVVIP